jgi:DNA polymerase I-like protein with 3'-5' exonuclease and polymerase domains
MSKDTRDKMKGQRWDDMTPEFKQEVEQYAMKDAENCLKLWLDHSHKWPEHERKISAMTREMAYNGVPLCPHTLESAKDALAVAVWEAEALVPWAKESSILSPLAVQAECQKVGIPFPGSLAQTSPEAAEWEETYSEQYPWIKAIRSYRKANKHLKTVETMLTRLREDGTMAYGLKYFGGHTGRDSGDSGWNAQNLPKEDVCGIDLRSTIKAPEGRTFVICDLAQIEPRVLHWLAEDHTMLRFIRESSDLYEAQARAWGLYDKEGSLKDTDKALRHTIKQLALGLGYGMGAKKFATVVNIPPAEAERLVTLYRSRNPAITALWRKLEKALRDTAMHPEETHAKIALPSGREMTYRNVSMDHGGLTTELPRNGKMLRLGTWGGSVCENLVQAVARDVFMDRCAALYDMGYKCCLRVHDEVVIEVNEYTAEGHMARIVAAMTETPSWATGLPLAAEAFISKTYTK